MKLLLVQHGEKLALLIILIVCAWAIMGVQGDAKTLPEAGEADRISIDKKINAVKTAQGQTPPSPDKPMDYTGIISKRLAVEVEFADTLQWLTGHPDVVEGSTGSKNVFSIYEVLQPGVGVEDEVGSVSLSIELPRDASTNDDKVKTGPQIKWERDLPNGDKASNRAYWVGLKIEFKAGTAQAAEWQALAINNSGLGKQGIYLFKDLENLSAPSFRHNGVTGKQHYEYRARLIVAATGINEEGISEIGEETIVYDGTYRGSKNRSDWASKGGKIKGRLLPLDMELPGVQLAAKEKLYMGSPGDVGVIEQAESDTIMALKQVSTLGAEPTMRLLMKKMHRDRTGEVLGWTEWVEFKDIKVGDKLGKPQQKVKIQGKEDIGFVIVDFSTDWRLNELHIDAERVYYYEVKKMSGQEKSEQYPDGIKLELRKKTRTAYHLGRINNGNETVELVRLSRLSQPERIKNYCYPILEEGDEQERFKDGDPLDFVPPILVPEEPKEMQPDQLPPMDLMESDKPFQTNIPYFIFPDDRVVFWDNVNNELRVLGAKEEEPELDPANPDGTGEEPGAEGMPEGGEEPPPQP